MLAAILLATVIRMPAGLPRGRKGAKFVDVFSKDRNINRLSAARLFLFGARDVWFLVGIPIYFHSVLSDGSEEGNRAAFFMIGSFMAVWTILYGGVQAWAPRLLRAAPRPEPELVHEARRWAGMLFVIPAVLAARAFSSSGHATWLTLTLVAGLLVFGAVFDVNSSLHSYLILAFSQSEALDGVREALLHPRGMMQRVGRVAGHDGLPGGRYYPKCQNENVCSASISTVVE